MRKARIAMVLLLATVLVAGFSCSVDSLDLSSCGLGLCSQCGTYVSQADSRDSIEIRSDNTAYLRKGGTQTSGTYRYNEVDLIITWQGYPWETRAVVRLGEILDQDGIVWAKQ